MTINVSDKRKASDKKTFKRNTYAKFSQPALNLFLNKNLLD